MKIVCRANETEVTAHDRLREVWYRLQVALDRPTYAHKWGWSARGINDDMPIEWSPETKVELDRFLRCEISAVTIEIEDHWLQSARPGSSLMEQGHLI